MLARQASLDISIETVNITADISPYLLSWRYTDNLDKLDEFSLNLRGDKFVNEWALRKGEKINATLNVLNWNKENDNRSLNFGEFSFDSDSFAGYPEVSTISAISIDITKNLKNERKTRSWDNITLKEISGEICLESDITLLFETDDVSFDRIEQTEESDLSLLSRLANKNGIQLKVINNQLVFFDEKTYEAKDSSFTFTKDSGIKKFNFKSNDYDTYDSCVISYTDSSLGETLEATYSASNREDYKTNTGRVLRINESGNVPGETVEAKISYLGLRAKKKLREKNKHEMTGSITVMGDPKYVSGLTCTCENFGKYNGKYIIEQVVHNGHDSYECTLNLRKTLEY